MPERLTWTELNWYRGYTWSQKVWHDSVPFTFTHCVSHLSAISVIFFLLVIWLYNCFKSWLLLLFFVQDGTCFFYSLSDKLEDGELRFQHNGRISTNLKCLLYLTIFVLNAHGCLCTLYFVPLMYMSDFVPVPYYFDYCSFVVLLSEGREGYASSFVLFPQDCFGNSGPFMVKDKF